MKLLLSFLLLASSAFAGSFSNFHVTRISSTAFYVDVDYTGFDNPGTLYYDVAASPVAVHCSTRNVSLLGGITYESEIFNPFASACSNAGTDFFWAVKIGSDTTAVQYYGSKTPTVTPTRSPTRTSSPTRTLTVSNTNTFSPTVSPTPTATPTFTATTSFTFSPTTSPTPSITLTNTFSPTVSQTFTFTPTATKTFTLTSSPTTSPTPTNSPVASATPTYTATAVSTAVPVQSLSRLRIYTENFYIPSSSFGINAVYIAATAHNVYSVNCLSMIYSSSSSSRVAGVGQMQNVPPAIYDFAVWLKFGVGAVDFSAIGGNQIGIFNDSAIVADASTNVSITASYLSPE